MDIEIKVAGTDDAAVVSALAAATFYETYFDTDDPQDLANYVIESFSLEKALAEISNPSNIFFLASIDGHVVGYAKFRSSEPPPELAGRNVAEVQRIYTFSRVSGKGVGSALMAECIDAARRGKYDGIWLGVWDQNKRAKGFYERIGFRKAGEIGFKYGSQSFVNEVMYLELGN